ncbi:MAG: hypothetical protein R3E68_21895 [Burkholderiaceae bacterium]
MTSALIVAQNPAIAGERPMISTMMITAMGTRNIVALTRSDHASFSRSATGVGSIPRRLACSATVVNRLA